MRTFDYTKLPAGLLTSETMGLLSAAHEYRGKHAAFAGKSPKLLSSLIEVARVQSAGASNRIEGIRTTDKRLRDIMASKTDLRSRDEEEIAGYRDVLALISENSETIDVTPNVILQLHKLMYRHTASSIGGHFKIGDNEIRCLLPDGSEYVRFRPMPAVSTPDAMGSLCDALGAGLEAGIVDPLLVSFMFVFDFTCIHPFNDGNGRMSRLLTLLLMYKAGYDIGRYMSVEQEIELTESAYYDALEESSRGWAEASNDCGPFVRYMLGVTIACYRKLDERISAVAESGLTKAERVEAFVRNGVGKVAKADILAACPDISETTVERTLAALLKQGKIGKTGAGRGTAYVWKG
jgi:Fic family protein